MQTEEQFRAARRKGIGASDVGAILGYSPHKTIHKVFMEKLGIDDTDVNEAMEIGNDIEEWIARRYVKKGDRGSIYITKPSMIIHPDYDWARPHVDGLVWDKLEAAKCGVKVQDVYIDDSARPPMKRFEPITNLCLCGLEIKNSGEYRKVDFGEEYTDDVPKDYVCQCQYSMWVTGLRVWDLAVLIGGNKFRVYRIKRNQKMIDAMIPRLRYFWEEHVLKKEPPPADASEDSQILLGRWFKEVDIEAELTPELDGLVRRYFTMQGIVGVHNNELSHLKNLICEKMGDCAKLVGPNAEYKVRWKFNNPKRHLNIDGVLAEAGVPTALVDKHTTYNPSVKRTFRATKTKAWEEEESDV